MTDKMTSVIDPFIFSDLTNAKGIDEINNEKKTKDGLFLYIILAYGLAKTNTLPWLE
jgi:hypothetical protein